MALAAALAPGACSAPAPAPLPAGDLQPTDVGWKWTYAVQLEGHVFSATRTLLAVEQRAYPASGRVLATPNLYLALDGDSSPVDKSLLPLVDGALHVFRESWFYAAWNYEPPIPLLAPGGRAIRWEGVLELRRAGPGFSGASSAEVRDEATEWVEVPAGRFPCVRTRTRHLQPPLEVLRWHAPGIGLVREEARLEGELFLEAVLTARVSP